MNQRSSLRTFEMVNEDSSNPNLGHSDCMGPKLREFVERQLIEDLNVYLSDGQPISLNEVTFDWSESCVEGHRTSYLDGELENFSGIDVIHKSNDLIAGGWMEFIETKDSLLVFWWYLHSVGKRKIRKKTDGGIPGHVWRLLDSNAKSAWRKHAPKTRRLP
jgi:hypothetical protein